MPTRTRSRDPNLICNIKLFNYRVVNNNIMQMHRRKQFHWIYVGPQLVYT